MSFEIAWWVHYEKLQKRTSSPKQYGISLQRKRNRNKKK
jgi:hypothetical protein